ncbi:hypothetical protein [Novosphingobium beihaiensis]|uniref:Asl1-like glycosyl hydrolase catalytic domain-containing protein n=1 Tax=Novosphingobium beihaiensis TaxID=2930389 RepID=A0ABT0BTN4_9SPHN|nr:hypothetical protein [Novosphingobium beihaiensis]MCJ2188394.1 hypothetical protein [Novosphingobium beihaiensis]
MLRDGVSWAAAEKEKGRIAFPASVAPLDQACSRGMGLVLAIVPSNPLYDGGLLVSSAEGQEAFGRYLDRVASRFGDCLAGIEVGNELNGAKSLGSKSYVQTNYAALMRAIYGRFKAAHPDVALIGGSTNAIGTGYLDTLFGLGLLSHADGIAVHPYRNHGENVDWEIAHLADTMRKHGKVLPVWATEFSDNFDAPAEGAGALVKMVTLLSGSGVRMASWYALVDQKWFPAMGLLTSGGAMKPAGRAFRLVQRELLPRGRPQQVSDTRLSPIWRYGADRWVVWGVPRTLNPAPGSQVFDAQGNQLSGKVELGLVPVVVFGARPGLGPSTVLADSLLQYGAAPWGYLSGAPGKEKPLAPLDSTFSTSLGNRWLKPMRIDDATGAVTKAAQITLRYTAPRDLSASLLGCFTKGGTSSSTILITVHAPGGGEIGRTVLSDAAKVAVTNLHLKAGQAVDIRLAPGSGSSGHTFRYRVRLFRVGSAPASCPQNVAGWQ